ncbi:MAG: peroxiredoxin [Myxococcales bacterium]|nr:peroxiredoxin [Myxococcales bacterium]MCB9651149.1 peroxiredoxin [Deltaproteobacteria bacterium]
MVKVGDNAPAFEALNQKREKISLGGFSGKKVVLAFFPAAFTGVCEKELCTFRDSMANFNDMDAVVLGVSVDAPFSNAAFAERNSLNFDVLSDYDRKMVTAYGVAHHDFAGMPGYTAAKRSVFVIDGAGKLTYTWVADNPGIEPNYDEVKAAVS